MTKALLGFIDETQRTDEQRGIHDTIMKSMPRFSMPQSFFGARPPVGTKILLPDFWKAAKIVKALGIVFAGFWQQTGSCIGAGGGNAIFTTACIDIAKNNEQEKPIIPCWLVPYGISRQLANMRGEGEGSLGSTFAKAMVNFGCPAIDDPELKLPQPKISAKGIAYSEQMELHWSNGAAIPSDVRTVAKKRPIRNVTPISDAISVRDSILNGYPVTRAGTFYVDYGTATIKNGVAYGRYNKNGGHQESWLGYWNHPTLGELIWEQNQWSSDCYVQDPSGGPRGGLWIPLDEVDKFCRHKYSEVYSWSQYEGYPQQPQLFDWLNQNIIA